MTDLAGNTVRQQAEIAIDNDGADGTVRGYTDTTEGIYFQYPYGWGESYTLGSDDGSMTTGLSDEPGVQSLYVDVHAGADPLAALESELEKAGTGDSEIT